MGNGEQYIWKPPEEDEMIMPGVPQLENGHSHPTAVEVTSRSLSQHCRRVMTFVYVCMKGSGFRL